MIKRALNAAAILVAMSAPALAAGKVWYVTEVGASGITGSQGTWTLTIDNNKISGTASMQFDNGNMLSYDVDGSLNDPQFNFGVDLTKVPVVFSSEGR